MSAKGDYYEILGVARDVDHDGVRRAYRALAMKYHPDRNPGDAGAEAKFKEITEAYSVLSDEQKRGAYDRFGHAGLNGGVDFSGVGIGDILSQFQDMFADFFGGFQPQGGRRRAPDRGQDVRVEATISLKDAFTGCKHEVSVDGHVPCEGCGASGAKAGSKPERCGQCGGRGQVSTQRGFITFASTCGRCRGRGEVIKEPCETCQGVGYLEKRRTVLVSFPPGIDTGQRLRVPAQGMPGPPDAPPGDLYVDVNVGADERLERQGNDLIAHESLSFSQAALGTTLEVSLPDGSPVAVEVRAGTQPGQVLSLKGSGMPVVNRRGRGDLHVVFSVTVPKKVSKKARQLLEALDAELGRPE